MSDHHHHLTLDRLRAILQDAHLNFLIGAGAPSAYFALLGDVENALTSIDQAEHFGATTRAVARASVQAYFFDSVIAPNVQLLAHDQRALPVLRSYAELGRTLNRILISRRNSLLSKKVNLFTTNVDLVFEVAFERLGIDLIDGFTGRLSPVYDLGLFGSLHFRTGIRYEHHSEAPTFDLYKLHGSVGWQFTSDPVVPSGIAFDRGLSDVSEVASRLVELRDGLITITKPAEVHAAELLEEADGLDQAPNLTAFTAAYDRLVIVNPETQKFAMTVLTETYYELIRRFANALERENSVLFVHGFSFRDEHLRKLMIRAARANPTLQLVVFCFSATDRDAYDELIPEVQVPNGNISYVLPQDGDDRLDLDTVVKRCFAPLASAPSPASDQRVEQAFDAPGSEPLD